MKPAIYYPPKSDSPVTNHFGEHRDVKNASGLNSTFSVACLGFFLLFLVLLAYIAFDRIEHNYMLNRIAGNLNLLLRLIESI